MKVYELAKELGVKSKVVLGVFDGHERINHHLDVLDDAEELLARTALYTPVETVEDVVTTKSVDTAETTVVEIESKQELPVGVTPEMVIVGIRGCGSKSAYWKFKDLVD